VTEEESVEVVPFESSLMDKKEMQDHLRRCHGVPHWNLRQGDKTTKGEMEVFHQRRHDDAAANPDTSRFRPALAHTHTAVPELSDRQVAALEKASNPLGKVLNAGERKSLKDLVDNDFAVMRTDITQFAHDLLAQRLAEIEAEYEGREVLMTSYKDQARELQRAYAEKINDLNESFRKKSEALADRAKRDGVTLTTNVAFRGPDVAREPGVELTGKKDAIARARDEVAADQRNSLNTLERQRLTNQRRILMLGVSSDGLQVIEEMPDARQLMVEAAKQRGGAVGALT
jgi:hypothetical protein